MSILFNNIYSLPHIETPYLIYRLTYAECQAYHSSLTLGYVIKNLDEKFKVVVVANNSDVHNFGYTYGNTHDSYNAPDILGSSWYELRIYCDDSIMNLGHFRLQSTVTSHIINYDYDGRSVTYDVSGKYYSLYRSDRDAELYYQERNLRTQIISNMQQIYNEYAQNYDPSQSFDYDIIRTVDILFDYSPSYTLLAEGTIATLSEDKTQLTVRYSSSSQSVSLRYIEVLLNSNFVTQINSSYQVVNLPTNRFRIGTNNIDLRTYKSDGSVSSNIITFDYYS